MRFHWPEDTRFRRVVLDVEQTACAGCGRRLYICAHRCHRIFTLRGPVELLCRLAHCSDPACPARGRTLSPVAELSLALPGWLIGWDVFCWLGHRRFARHWSVPQLQAELDDASHITLSTDAISLYLRRYQTMVAARQQDPKQLAKAYEAIDGLVLSIDGLQPEKGHETLYAVRELVAQRVWFAEALLSSKADEVRRVLIRARKLAKWLGKPIRLWLSDKQDAFVTGLAAEFPGIPHRYCVNHFIRDLAKPMLAIDSQAKAQMRKKVRGLREIEREVLDQRQRWRAEAEATQKVTARGGVPRAASVAVASNGQASHAGTTRAGKTRATATGTDRDDSGARTEAKRCSQVVLDYCAAVRGILNDDQGGPLSPPGLRMALALVEVRASLQSNLDLNKPVPAHGQLKRLVGCIDRGLAEVKARQQQVREQVKEIQQIAATLEEATGTMAKRQAKYERLQRHYERQGGECSVHLRQVMQSWRAGLFVPVQAKRGEKLPSDNLDLERWFRKPKGHERRIHGHKHAGVRIVEEGATLVLVLDAHEGRRGPFTVEDLFPYRNAEMPPDECETLLRRKIMRKARSKKNALAYS
jgi:hypothetical protein